MPKTHVEFLSDLQKKIKAAPMDECTMTKRVNFTREEITALEDRMQEINTILVNHQIKELLYIAKEKGLMDNA